MTVEQKTLDTLKCPTCEREFNVFRHKSKTPGVNYTKDGGVMCKCGYEHSFLYKMDDGSFS